MTSPDAGGGSSALPDAGGAGSAPAVGRSMSDMVAALLILAFTALVLAITLTFDTAPPSLTEGMQPATFPRLALLLMAGLALLLMVEARQVAPRPTKAAVRPIVWVSALLVMAFPLAFAWLGVLPAMVLVCLLLPPLWGERRPAVILPFALALPATVYLIFAKLLDVYFAPSPFLPF